MTAFVTQAHVRLLTLYFALMPVLAIYVPRILGTLPIIFGILGLLFFFTNRPLQNKPLIALLFAFLLLAWASLLWSPEPALGLDRATKLSLFFVTLTGLFISTQTYNTQLLKYLPLMLGVASVLLLVEYAYDYPVYRMIRGMDAREKLKVSILNRASVAHVLLLWPACLYLLQNQKQKFIFPLIALILAASIFIFSSQTALFGLLIGLICWGLAKVAQKSFPILIFAGTALTLIFTPFLAKLLYTHPPDFIDLMHVAGAPQRVSLWHAVANMALESPFYGHGLEATHALGDTITKNIENFSWRSALHPHNFALQIWIEFGLIGVLFFCGWLTLTYTKFQNYCAANKPLFIATLSSALAMAAIGYGMWQSWWLGILLTTTLAIQCLSKEETTGEKNGK